MNQPKYYFFASCIKCGEQVILYQAPDPEEKPCPPADSKTATCLHCGTQHTYWQSEMQLAVE